MQGLLLEGCGFPATCLRLSGRDPGELVNRAVIRPAAASVGGAGSSVWLLRASAHSSVCEEC